MARMSVATQRVRQFGLDPVLTAPTSEGDVVDTGRVFLWVDNADVAALTVTVQTPAQVSGLDVAELQVTVPAGEVRLIGPLPVSTFGRPHGDVDAGKAYVDYTGADVASVARGVFSL